MVGEIWIDFTIRVLVEKHINGPRPSLVPFYRRPCSARKKYLFNTKNECNSDSWILSGVAGGRGQVGARALGRRPWWCTSTVFASI